LISCSFEDFRSYSSEGLIPYSSEDLRPCSSEGLRPCSEEHFSNLQWNMVLKSSEEHGLVSNLLKNMVSHLQRNMSQRWETMFL
jgi:hypothetical protein